MKKQLISVILTLVLVIGLLPAFGRTVRAEGYTNTSGVGAEGDTSHRVHWTLYRDGTLYLCKNDRYAYLDKGDDSWAGEIFYKRSDNEPPVKEEYGKYLVKTLIVEVGIEWIPEHMFEKYINLGNVILPGLKGIDPYAFYGCEDLFTVTVGSSVEKIGDHAFEKCKSLNAFTVNGTVGSVGASAFRACDLREFTAPITGDIGAYAFADQPLLCSVSPIRGSVGTGAFEGAGVANSFRKVYIVSSHSGTLGDAFIFDPNNSTGHSTLCYTGTKEEFEARYVKNSRISPEFRRLGSNARWDLEDGVLIIHKIYDDLYGKSTIDLLDATEQPWLNIPGRTWDENREQITRVEVSGSIQLGAHMLDGLEDLVVILHDHEGTLGALHWTMDDGILTVGGSGAIPNMYGRDDAAWMPYRNEIREIVIEDGVTAVGFGAFSNCPELKAVSFPDSVTEIAGGTFYGCQKLNNVSLPDNLKTLGRNAFTDCTGLKRIFIPKAVGSVGSQCFLNTGLEDIYFGGTTAEWNALNVGDVGGAFIHPSSYGLLPSVGESPSGTQDAGNSDKPTDTPKTGNSGDMLLWFVLACVSGAALVLLISNGIKRKARNTY